jgi:hypothetical protein
MARILLPLVLLVLVSALTIFAGCTGGGREQAAAQTTPAPGGALYGITITSPADGAVLPAGDVTVTVRVTNFTLVPEYGRSYVPGEGHLHYSMGVGVPERPASSSSVAPISYAATTATSYTWPDVPAGTYTFTVELANNDHSPFPRPLESSVTVKVTGETPATTGH